MHGQRPARQNLINCTRPIESRPCRRTRSIQHCHAIPPTLFLPWILPTNSTYSRQDQFSSRAPPKHPNIRPLEPEGLAIDFPIWSLSSLPTTDKISPADEISSAFAMNFFPIEFHRYFRFASYFETRNFAGEMQFVYVAPMFENERKND